MKNRSSVAVLFALAVFASMISAPASVVGQQSSGEIYVSPSDSSLAGGDTQTIEVKYDSRSAANPKGIEFALNYDSNVISVVDATKGGYLESGFGTGPTTSPGEVSFGRTQVGPVSADSGTVATITVKLADGVSQGDITDLTFAKAKTIGTENSPETVSGAIEAAEDTDNAPQDQRDVQVTETSFSADPVDASPGNHILKFELKDVSADNERDNITVTLPESVVVEDITTTTVTNASGETVRLVGENPATLPNPGNKINLAVNPLATAETQDLNVKVGLTLSAES